MKAIGMKHCVTLALALVAGVAACEGEVMAPSSGGASDEPAALDGAQAADLAQAESSGQVSTQGRVLTLAEGEALVNQIQQALAGKAELGSQATADGQALLAAPVPGRPVTPMNVMLQPHSGYFASANIWVFFPQWGGWLQSHCFDLPRPGAWKSVGLTVPNDVDVFFDGFKSSSGCFNGKPDLQVSIHSPARPTTANFWVQVF